MTHRTMLSYYGGKGMIVNRFDKPKCDTLIEPFAGGAAYSLKYYYKNVIINDLNADLIAAWQFVQSKNAISEIRRVPTSVNPGDKISDLGTFDPGLTYILRAAANVGTAGQNKKMDTITKFGAIRWFHNTVSKVEYWHPRIKHWTILSMPYDKLANVEATWFIDPPYGNDAGLLYKYGSDCINFNDLADFCKTRKGQVIVCENEGADWLDNFSLISKPCGVNAKHISKKRPGEVVAYINNF